MQWLGIALLPYATLCVDAGTLHIKRSVPASVIVYFGVIA